MGIQEPQYKSGATTAQRAPIYIDANKDPRARDQAYLNLYSSRVGAPVIVVDGVTGIYLGSSGLNSGIAAAGNNGTGPNTPNPDLVNHSTLVGILQDPQYTASGISNLAASWVGANLLITWDFDATASNNKYVDGFIIDFLVNSEHQVVKQWTINTSSQSQSYLLTKSANFALFGIAATNITSISVNATDIWGNSGPVSTISGPIYNNGLTAPIISRTNINGGYNISVSNIADQPSNLNSISIEEYVSDASSAPTGVTYSQVYLGSLPSVSIITPNTLKRWVKARFTDGMATYGPYSEAVLATPQSAVAVDNVPPAEVGSVSAAWSGDNIVITYSGVATDTVRFQAELTAPNSLVGYFYFFPETSGTHTISSNDLFLQFGEHYNSFNPCNLKSIDSSDNRSSGLSFTVPVRNNPLALLAKTDVNGYFSLTGSANSYVVNIKLPNYAKYAEVYDKTTSWTSDPTDETYRVAAGYGALVVPVSNTTDTHYVKIRFYDDFGYTSAYSDGKQVTPYDPGTLSLISNPIKIQTDGTIFAGDSATAYPRVYFNKDGLFAYDAGGNQTTQIINSALNGQATFKTTKAQIADWFISSTSIENSTISRTNDYSGLSGTGIYSFWAGSSTPGGSSTAEFYVKPDGTVKANNITITGGSLQVGSGFSVAAITGKLTATDGEFTGKLEVKGSSTVTGNLQVTSGSFYTGTSTNKSSVVINTSGLAAYDATTAGGNATTQILTTAAANGATFITSAAKIGAFLITSDIGQTSGKIQNSAGTLVIDSTASAGDRFIVKDATNNYQLGIAIPANGTASSKILYAGQIGTPNFFVTAGGTLNATGAIISGNIKATSGYIGSTDGTTGWTITSSGIQDSTGTITLNGTTGTITGATITGGVVQTGSGTTTRRIVMGASQPDRIDFYPKTGDDADTAGYLWVSDDAGNATLPGLVLRPPTKSTWASPPKIKMTQTSAGGFLYLSAVQTSVAGSIISDNYIQHTGNLAIAFAAHRNISAGSANPSGGNLGDVYIQY